VATVKKSTGKMKKAVKKGMKKKVSRAKDLELRVEMLERMVAVMATGWGYRSVLDELLTLNRQLIDAEAGTVMLLDTQNEQLVFEAVQGQVAGKLLNFRLPIDRGVAGWVARHGEALLIPRATKDPRYDPSVSKETAYETKNMICVPICCNNTVIGVLQLLNRQQDHRFTREDLEVTEKIAERMGSVLRPLVKQDNI